MKNKININKAKQSCLNYYNKVYDEYNEKYSDEIDKKPYDKNFLKRFMLAIKKKGEILDIGCCSSAQQARFFRDNGYKVTCIDISKKCIETAKHKFSGINFLYMDMLEMDFKPDTFDAINAFYSIIHIPDEKLRGLFNDFNKVLKIKGKLAITVHAGDFYGFYNDNELPVFYRTYSQDDLKILLDSSGFKIIEINQRQPIYDFEFQSERIYLIAEKTKNIKNNSS